MGKPHPMELRTRIIDFVEEGNTHHSGAFPCFDQVRE